MPHRPHSPPRFSCTSILVPWSGAVSCRCRRCRKRARVNRLSPVIKAFRRVPGHVQRATRMSPRRGSRYRVLSLVIGGRLPARARIPAIHARCPRQESNLRTRFRKLAVFGSTTPSTGRVRQWVRQFQPVPGLMVASEMSRSPTARPSHEGESAAEQEKRLGARCRGLSPLCCLSRPMTALRRPEVGMRKARHPRAGCWSDGLPQPSQLSDHSHASCPLANPGSTPTGTAAARSSGSSKRQLGVAPG